MVKSRTPRTGTELRGAERGCSADWQVRMDRPDPRSYWGRLAQRLDISSPEHLVLLDVGMVAELTADDQAHLVQFFKVRLSRL